MPKGYITEDLLDAMMMLESNGNTRAINQDTGARGLYQFTEEDWVEVQEKFDELDKYEFFDYVHNPQISRKFARARLQMIAESMGKKYSFSEMIAKYKGMDDVLEKGVEKAPRMIRQYIDAATTMIAQGEAQGIEQDPNPIQVTVPEEDGEVQDVREEYAE